MSVTVWGFREYLLHMSYMHELGDLGFLGLVFYYFGFIVHSGNSDK